MVTQHDESPKKEVCLRELPCFSWRLVEACGLIRDAMKLFCKTTQIARKSTQKSTVSLVGKGNNTGDPDLVDLVTGLYLKLVWASRNPSCDASSCEVRHQALGWWRSHTMDLRFSLLPMPFMMEFTLVLVGRGYHCHVCENSAPARGALDWHGNTICSRPPSSHPSVPVRVGRQILHESHRLRFHRGLYWCTTCGPIAQHAAGTKSRVIGLVNECPGYLDTCRSRGAGAHRKGTRSKSVSGLAADARYGLNQQ